MAFTITISRPPLAASFEAGSIAEANGILEAENTALTAMFRTGDALVAPSEAQGEAASEAAPARRGRGPAKPKPEAVAPPPLAVPGAPPVLPNAPPVALAPPSGVLGGKVVAALKALAAKGGDGGASLVTWLAQPGVALVVPAATFDEACAVVLMTTDEKLAPIATALSVA